MNDHRPTCIKVHQFRGHTEAIYTLLAAGDGNSFYSAGGDGMVVRWSLDSPDQGSPVARVDGSVYSMGLDPTGKFLAFGKNNDGIHVIDLALGKKTGSIHLGNGAIFDLTFQTGRILAACGDGRLVSITPGSLTLDRVLPLSENSLRCLAINPQDGSVAVGGSDHRIRILNARTLEVEHNWVAHANSVFTLSYAIGEQLLVSGSRDAHVKTWKAVDQYHQLTDTAAHLFAVNHIAFRGDGKHFLTCSMDKTIKVWTSGPEPRLQRVLDRARHAGHGNSVNRICWINADTFASAGDDRMISVWKFLPA